MVPISVPILFLNYQQLTLNTNIEDADPSADAAADLMFILSTS
jgi:hypothetical protein